MNAKVVGILSRLALVAFLATGMLACVEDDQNQLEDHTNPGEPESIEVEGTWDTNFGGVETIDDEAWDFMLMTEFDNEERWAITQNPSDSEFNADQYNLLVWTPIEDDVFHYCTVAFGMETAEDARTAENTSDSSDLDGEGCGGFSWTEMTRQ